MFIRRRLTETSFTALLIFFSFTILNAQNALPAGTRITLKMDNGISSASASVDDTFTAITVEPVKIRGVTLLPAETTIVGRVSDVEPAATAGKPGKLRLDFETIRFPGGTERKMSGVLVNELKGPKSGVFNTIAVVTGTAVGGLIGWFTKSGSGAAIGAGVGAGAGTGVALSRKGKNVGIDSKQVFEIELTKEVNLPADGF